MKRREFITLIGGAAAWPLTARAQQPDRMRRIGVLMHVSESDPDGQARLTAFVESLKELGWAEGRNLHLEVRWGTNDPNRYPRQAAELVAMAPDALVAPTSFTLAPLQRATRSVPIVFMGVIDPVGAGIVNSLARPGGNTTGFVAFEYTIGAKWLELLKDIAPHVTRAAVLRDPSIASGIGQFAAIQTAGAVGIDLSVIAMQDAGETEQAIAAFASDPNGGLVVTASPFGANHPDLVAALAARYKLPAIYPFRYFVSAGGLISYGADLVKQSRPAAAYVDRILKGEKPADLPVQAPTKYDLVINLKTAKTLGLEFITLIVSGATAWPLAVRAQQPAMPVIGFLHVASANAFPHLLAGFRQGLKETGIIEGENITIEYRWAEGQYDRLIVLARDLVARNVNVLVAVGGEDSALAAKAATGTIPIAFLVARDPVIPGLVASLSQPRGNATGVNLFGVELGAKRLGLLHEVVPAALVIGLLTNPNYLTAETEAREIEEAARLVGRTILVLKASNENEIDSAFYGLKARVGALIVGTDPFFNSRRERIIALAEREALPAMYDQREFPVAGGLMSYGTSLVDAYRQVGVYAGRMLHGEKPSALPVLQPTKFELVINLRTAKALGLEVPATLLARADEVIE